MTYEEERLNFARIFTTICLSIACKLRDKGTKEPTRRTWEIRRYKHGLEDELHFPERKWLSTFDLQPF